MTTFASSEELRIDLVIERPPCSTCRGFGYVESGHCIRNCPECLETDLMEFSRGLRDSPPCYGYASCREECMGLCPWAEGCRGVSR